MNDLQALVVGALIGALMKAPESGILVDVEVPHDDDGNYVPWFYVTGRESGERLRVTVDVAGHPGIGTEQETLAT